MKEDDHRKNARNSDPRTSHEGADRDNAKDEAKVWACYVLAGRPLATFEMEELLGGPRDGKWRKRRCDLSRDGLLVCTGEERIGPKGKPQQVWTVNRDVPPQMDLGL